ncbi:MULTISPECIES: FAD binding domain-containing protein [Amycolatopsis]|uniref:Carbon-monoxide dehydrogenase medium subunit n=1 Tax=Amycolatopsis echigonensis TaxID=2576905 RepID=A0A2N3WNP7_9PSEU|nr:MULTISPECIES: xanthine dehydrogenase family protein subunit M [Amycolatopsis]PKV95487.1 carbon-monoxide dehydrogenase medium subunit [Amycolatopsis niigatensis]
MKLPALRYVAPRTIEQACALLDADDDAKIVAGGQSLMPLLAIRLAIPSTLVDIGRIPGLDRIEEAGDYLRVGAMVTHERVITSPLVRERLPLMIEAGRNIAHVQIRSRGTIGGSIVHGDNAGEWPLALLTLGGAVEVQSVRGRRTIPAEELFLGPYMTSIRPDEILTDVWLPTHARGWSFHEVARRAGDYGLALVGVRLEFNANTCTAATITVGAAVGTLQRVTAAEEAVIGSDVDRDAARSAGEAAAASLSFISDIHGSREYRAHLVAGLVERAVADAGGRR